MFARVRHLVRKEFLQMLRDPRMRVVILGMPIIQMTIMAFALTTDVTDIGCAVLDLDNSALSRRLVADFTASGYFRFRAVHPGELNPLIDRGEARAALIIPEDFARKLLSGHDTEIQLITDGSDSNSTAIISGYAQSIAESFNESWLRQNLAKKGITTRPPLVSCISRSWFNVNQESRLYFVPALIAVMLFIFSILLPSIGIVREKEIGTIEQVMVTPIGRLDFVLGKTLPYLATSYFTMTVMLIVAMMIFDVRVAGSMTLLYILTGLYLFGNMGLALVISSSAKTQQQALLTSFLVMMPSVLLSGFMFPIHNMPEPAQIATWLNPMRWYLEILRGIVLRGVGLEILWPQIAAQSALSFFFLTLAALRFKKTLR
ncbi:MAG: ABC transporter permease [Desulfobulbaceae bacterium]|jgi:ABC-2 type transport system permease protein|nr:ABC transporter permease [Desulfobulbaceae bacterium]